MTLTDHLRVDSPGAGRVRVCLRPGVRVVRRDETHRQVGLDHLAVVVADGAATDHTLDLLATGGSLDASRIEPRLRTRLAERGLLVDTAQLAALSPSGTQARESVVSAYAAHGPAAAARLAARRAAAVDVSGPDGWAAEARRLLTVAGVTLRGGGRVRPGPDTAMLVLSAGELRRGDLDDVVRAGRPHLVVASVQGRFRVGPFVVPGVTACLRCLDAHLAEHDPRRALVVEQQSQHAATPEPVDPVLGTLALGLAVRDLVAWAEGERPTTWSATITVDAGSDLLARPWTTHPCCGCGWGSRLPVD